MAVTAPTGVRRSAGVNLALGVLVMLVPFLFGADVTASHHWNNWTFGFIIVLLAALTLFGPGRPREGGRALGVLHLVLGGWIAVSAPLVARIAVPDLYLILNAVLGVAIIGAALWSLQSATRAQHRRV
jgi:hypothetical protein